MSLRSKVTRAEMVDLVLGAYGTIRYREDVDLAMAEKRLELKYRVPDEQRLKWARQIVEAMGDRIPKVSVEAYAREQIVMHERQSNRNRGPGPPHRRHRSRNDSH